jgi:hypothetical protein
VNEPTAPSGSRNRRHPGVAARPDGRAADRETRPAAAGAEVGARRSAQRSGRGVKLIWALHRRLARVPARGLGFTEPLPVIKGLHEQVAVVGRVRATKQ